MPRTYEITIGELVRIAFSGSRMTPAHIGLLHTIFDILWKKLECAEESIGVYGLQDTSTLKDKCKLPILCFPEDQLTLISHKVKAVSDLSARTNEIKNKINKHLAAEKVCLNLLKYDCFQCKSDGINVEPSDCILEPEKFLICDLMWNADFLKKLSRFVVDPVIRRLPAVTEKLISLSDQFTAFKQRSQVEFPMIGLADRCCKELRKLSDAITRSREEFAYFMEEAEDDFDVKADESELVALQSYVRTHFKQLKKLLCDYRKRDTCPENAGLFSGDIQCLECGGRNICAEKTVNPLVLLPSMIKKPSHKKKCNNHVPLHSQIEDNEVIYTMNFLKFSQDEATSKSLTNESFVFCK